MQLFLLRADVFENVKFNDYECLCIIFLLTDLFLRGNSTPMAFFQLSITQLDATSDC